MPTRSIPPLDPDDVTPAAWRWCLVAGLVAFTCARGFGRITGLIACGPTGGLEPIIAFELARTLTDVATLFGTEPCRSTLAAAQHTGLWLDALGFIPSYTAFLCLAAWATCGRARRWIVSGLLVAGAADEIEGVLLFAILRALPGTPALLHALFWTVHVKFVLLAIGTLAIGLLLTSRRPVALVGGIIIAAGAVWALIDLAAPGMMIGFTIAWAALLFVAALASIHPSLVSSARARPLPAPASPSA